MIQGVLLAAGLGRRFGGQKLLARLPDGRPVARAAVEALAAGADDVLAVARPGEERVAELLAGAGARVLVAPESERGMGASLAAGVRATPEVDAWLIALGDMPWVRGETAAAVAERLRAGASLVRPVHRGRAGHPVGFARDHGAALAAMEGDRGARGVLEAHAGRVRRIAVTDPGILRDVDAPADLGPAGGVGEA
ncbi:MAG: NTP transferase domain-containing protein [Thiohalorhabdus sp.]|uniref:nucleotidyltransferase family protein n=1 Tax=Thiohalorhabdus sp. TaxID=3094134 RepID=UPI003980A0F6